MLRLLGILNRAGLVSTRGRCLRTARWCAWSAVVWGLALASPLAASAATGGCPNEELRSELHSGQLPECRAYEMVTPPYKEGSASAYDFAVSENGDRLIESSFVGAFAGAEEAGLNFNSAFSGVAYEYARGPGGWVAHSLGPSASEYNASSEGMFDIGTGLEGGVWELSRLSQPEGVTGLFLERPWGTFVEIGPATLSPVEKNAGVYSYAGVSGDLSHVLFTINVSGFYWPSDATVPGLPSLYEYVGRGRKKPALIGVSGEGESTELISQCGTRMGSSRPERAEGSMYNAVSASGNRTFFTAVGADDDIGPPCGGKQPPVDELFAREEAPQETPSGETKIVTQTIPISEPSLDHCSESPHSPCADGHFEGASQDGSKVFFTSKQQLLPDAAEGSLNLYEYEFEPGKMHRLLLVSAGSSEPDGASVQGVARISEDGSHVYFVAQGVLTGTATNRFDDSAKEGADNLYVYDTATEETSFIATLSLGDAGDWSRVDARPVLTSQDGRFLVFLSETDITHEGIGAGVQQVFQYDAETGALVRASIGQDGYDDNGRIAPPPGAELPSTGFARSDSPTLNNSSLATEDGIVFFESAAALTPQALSDQTNAQGEVIPNVYEYQNGMVYLISDGQDTATVRSVPGSVLLGYDPSGSNVFFMTSDPLIAEDTDTQRDIYDARVDGGFPPPSSPLGCVADGCQGPLSPSPPAVTLGGSETQTARGDVPPSTGESRVKPKPKKAKAKKRARRTATKRRVKGARKAARKAARGSSALGAVR